MRTPQRPWRQLDSGFTLVEVMVAMFIMAMLAAMAWQGVDGIVRARDASASRLEQTLRLNTVLSQWEQDLAAVQETAAVDALMIDGANLRLTRRTERGMQLVVWSLRPGLPGARPGNTLLRWASAPMSTVPELKDAWMRSQQFQGGEPRQVRTLEGLASWQLYCFRGTAWSNCQSSGNVKPPELAPEGAPPSTQPAGMQTPEGVRLMLTFAEGQGPAGSLTRDVRLGPVWPQ